MDLSPFLFTTVITLGWAVIFYPFMRRAKTRWDILILIATSFSLAILILKEIILEVNSPFSDIFTYGLGILFGVLVLYSFFRLKSSWLEGLPNDDMSFRDHRIEGRVPMRHLFQAAILLEEHGENFYSTLAEKASDEEAKRIWQKLANDETTHKRLFEKTLSRWLPRPADSESLDSLIEELRSRGLFSNPPLPDATEEEVVQYAVHNEEVTADFYLSFEKAFPDAWKKLRIQELVTTERQHAEVGRGKTSRDLLRLDIAGPFNLLLKPQPGDELLDLGQVGDVGRIAGPGLATDHQQAGIGHIFSLDQQAKGLQQCIDPLAIVDKAKETDQEITRRGPKASPPGIPIKTLG